MSDGIVPTVELAKAEGALMPLVESYYLYRYGGARGRGVERVDVGQIRFLLRGEGDLIYPGAEPEPSHPVMVTGPNTCAGVYDIRGPMEVFGVVLRAIGWKALIGLPAHKVANHLLDGATLLGPKTAEVLAKLQRAKGLDEMIAIVEPFLLARRKPVPRAHLDFARVVREWAATDEPAIDGLYARLALSPRQATRLCNEYFGGPPKLLERKFRAIRAAMRIYQGEDLGEAAARFADEPHMIRELRHFTGHTPGTLKGAIDPVLALSLENETFHFLPDVIPESVDPGAA